MSRRAALLSLVAFAGIGVACSLGGLDGLSSGSLPQPPGDSGVPNTPDASTADAGTTDSGAASFRCGAHPDALLCATFDDDPFDVGFDPSGSVGGRISTSTTSFVTAPRALLASVDGRTDSRANAFLQRNVSGLAKLPAFTLSWEVRVGTSMKQTAVDIGGLNRSGAPYWSLHVRYSKDPSEELQLFEYGNESGAQAELVRFTPLSRGLAPGRFSRLELRVAVVPNASTATVFVDGAAATVAVPITFDRYPGSPFVMMGITGTDGSGDALDVHVDNVLLEPH